MLTPSGNTKIDALAYASWNAKPGTPLTLTYSFPASAPPNATGEDRAGFAPMTAAQKDDVRTAMATWSAVANVTFREVTSGGKLQLATNDQGATSAAYAYYPQPYAMSGLYLNNALSYNTATASNAYRINVLVHELGHSLGLKHPGDYNAGGGGSPGPYLPGALDNSDYTMMSYYDGASKAIDGKRPAAPMLLDILAMQYLYGANTAWHAGNDVYTFTNTAAPQCIWDAGGINTLDFSACTGATIIDLNAGAFSETAPGLHNVALAYGVAVQRAVAGAGGATIRANDLGNLITGGAGADEVLGGAGNDTITGGAGNDRLQGGRGSDVLDGGSGRDTLAGGAGDDRYVVDSAQDVVDETAAGSDGVDTLLTVLSMWTLQDGVEVLHYTGSGAFSGKGNALDNRLAGGAGNDLLAGAGGNDRLDGGGGADTLDGGTGNDIMLGGLGDDVYLLDAAGDVITEGESAGRDMVRTTLAALTLMQNVEDLAGTVASRAYRLTGNGLDNVIAGNSGNDTLAGGAGNDTLRGMSGRDSLLGGEGDDRLEGGSGGDTLDGGAGSDTAVFESALGNYERSRPTADDLKLVDKISGAAVLVRNTETLVFAGVSYTLAELRAGLASPGREQLAAGALDAVGGSLLDGTAHHDVHHVGSASDVIVEAVGGGFDTALVTITAEGFDWTLGENVESVVLRGMTAGTVTGNALANAMQGDGAANTLDGAAGDDILEGGAGTDHLLGGAGGDLLNGGRGADVLEGGTGDDVYIVDDAGDVVLELADGGNDRVITAQATWQLDGGIEQLRFTGTGAFAGTGSELDNILVGGAWNDRLDGGAGNDTLVGGAGSDTLTGGAGNDTFVLRLSASADRVTDFVSGSDRLEIDAGRGASLTIVTRAAADLTQAAAARAIGPADQAHAIGASALFVVNDGTSTALFRFQSADGNATVSAGELTQIAQLTGVGAVTVNDVVLL
ncbi:M10 family metallopeptidase C-terminal domain-containing protein [[Empedobacter] haloabium]|uniref:M10 family metallopeptidase C-terminal domain-containing protein n=1 Tax=[Empedobacter] haloabium TaxID=592317 RepID=A0ABZ1UNI0_9BURK